MRDYHHLKEECLLANLALPEHGLIDLTFGNVSVADHAAGVFAIKPSGVDYARLKAEDIVIVAVADGRVVAGGLRPSSDTPTHRCLFQAFAGQGIRAIVHTHSRHAVAWAQAGRSIPCLGTTHADYFYGAVPITRPMTAPEIEGEYEWETGRVILECLRDVDPTQISAVLVHGHGPFAWGTSGRKALENALALEIVAEMAARTLQINGQADRISPALLDKHFLRKHGPRAYYGQPG